MTTNAIRKLSVSTTWVPITVLVNWDLKAMDLTASVSDSFVMAIGLPPFRSVVVYFSDSIC